MYSLYLLSLFCSFQLVSSVEKRRDTFIHSIDENKYETLLLLVQGKFNVPVNQRTRSQKSAIVQFWRRKELFTLGPEKSPTLYFNGRKVVKKGDVSRIVGKTFKETKSAGYKKLKYRAADSYAGLTERQIRHVTSSDNRYRIHNAKFTNKVLPKPVRAKHVQSQHQIDLIDFSRQPIKYAGKTYRYILSVIDVFSRFLWLAPLEKKSSRPIARKLKRIYDEHGPPDRLQSDRGLEFYGHLEKLCKKYKMKRIRSRPYHPQSQGKVERSHRRFRTKLVFDLISLKTKGVNWVQNLPTYCRILNEEKKEELGWLSPFEVYFGRKSNVVVKAVLEDYDIDSCPRSLKRPKRNDISKHQTCFEKNRERAKVYTRKLEERMINRHKRQNPHATQYSKGDKVLIRLKSRRRKIAPKRRHVLPGKVIDRRLKTSMYKIEYLEPNTCKLVQHWISLEDIASISRNEKLERKRTKMHRQKYHIPLTSKDRQAPFEDRGVITFDPPGDGNCQFSAICFWLRNIGVERSAETLRKDLVKYLRDYPNDIHGFPLELYVGQAWSDYLMAMSEDGTYGDHITLQAVSNLFNVQLTVHSSLGVDANTVVSPFDGGAVADFHLGHFAEGEGEHYVCLEVEDSDSCGQIQDGKDESENVEKNENENERDENENDESENEKNENEMDENEKDDSENEKNENERDENEKDESENEKNENERDENESENEKNENKMDENERDEKNDIDENESEIDEKAMQNENMDEPEKQKQGKRAEQDHEKERCSFEQLPNEMVTMILERTLRSSNQSDICFLYQRLRSVCSQFRKIVDRFMDLLPRIYFRDGSPGVVSIRRIIKLCGPSSGLVLELKNIIKSNRWHHAWLHLYALGFGWFIIKRLFWRQRKRH